MPPKDKNVEQRKQTQQKLELMERYWAAYCNILARSVGKGFCNTHLWLIDAMAGRGLHDSALDPDGNRPGTPLQAVLAARDAQRAFPAVTVHVRASDIKKDLARELDARLAPHARDVDLRVDPMDWVKAAPAIQAEVASGAGHAYAGRHDHRSLWFIDPYGWKGIDRKTISALPIGAEVIINLDLTSLTRHAGRTEAVLRAELDELFGSHAWADCEGEGYAYRLCMAKLFADSYASKFRFRETHPLRSSAGQERFMIHLANTDRATKTFTRHVGEALRAGTVVAGKTLHHTQKDLAAKALWEKHRGRTMTIDELYDVDASYDRGQLRAICKAAADDGYGSWNRTSGVMEWRQDREPDPTLGL